MKRTRKNLRKRAKILEYRITKLRSDLHRRAVKFLTDKYDTIIIPKFRTQKMCEKLDSEGNFVRGIKPETARRLQLLAHFKFRELLRAKGGNRVFVGTEEYTSITCGNCFQHNKSLGGKRTFECSNCKLVGHRDILAARNIMVLNAEPAGLLTERLLLAWHILTAPW